VFKTILKLFLVIPIYLFLCTSTSAFEFVKTTENPLKVRYINDYVNELQHHIFKEDNLYKGIFVINRTSEIYHSLGYFESINGFDWVMKKEILNNGEDLSNPGIIETQTGYLLFVTLYENNSVYKIYSITCDSEFNCSSNLTPVIMPDTKNNSEKNGVFAGRPFKQDSRTYLFFGAWGGDGFKIKLAYSDDLLTWQRCQYGFLYDGDGPFPYQENNELYLFFHKSDSSGIKYAKTTLPLSCSSSFEDMGYLLTKDKEYDQKHLIFPSVLNDEGGLKMYYSGLGSDSRWKLNLACTSQACLFPTEVPTPTTTQKHPIIIIPGFMASWNRDAILHNQTVDYSAWKLQHFVKEYDGLINTLKNIGYQENVNLFLFSFDWRQTIDKTTEDLHSFLQEKIWNNNPNQKINIVGHSLGGVVGRIFTQKNIDKINHIISVGSPHFGAVQFYKPLEAGEIDRANTFLWLAEKIVLVLNKSTLESDRVTITNKFPVAKDLFPTFNFLKNTTGAEIPVDNLSIKNSFLNTYNQTFPEIFPIFNAIVGEKDKNTLAGFVVESQNSLDKLLGNYPDGKPKESYSDFGDYLILSKSASQDTDLEKFYFDHGEIITKKEAIKKILSLLNINYSDDQIVEGQITKISSSLIFMIKSPAMMKVEFENSIYPETEGIIFIPNAQSGSYDLKVQGVDQGKYEVVIGQISENNDVWESIKGEITQSPASSQIDDYNIPYKNQTAVSIISPTATPTMIITLTLTPTATPLPTSTPQPTISSSNSTSSSSTTTIASSNNEIPISKESTPEILGISSMKEELITPIIEVAKKTEVNKDIKKILNIWDYVWASITSFIVGGIGYIFRRKILKK